MSKPNKNFIELNKLNLLNKNLANLHLTKRMPTAPARKIVANKLDIKADLKKLKSQTSSTNPKRNRTRNSSNSQLNRTRMANVSFEDDLDMAMTSAGYALYIAIKRQQLRDIVRLLEAGAHYHIKSGLRGGGPLHQLISLCPGELLKRFRLKAAEVMLDYGVDANLTDFYGKTALMMACSEGHLELVKLLSPKTDPLIQDCRLNTALIYAVLGQKVSCTIEHLKSTQLPIVTKVIRIRNGNGYNALDLARQLGNRELILHLTHYLGFAEQNTIKAIKQGKLDPRYADNYWLYRQKKYWRPDYYDSWHSPYYRMGSYWNTSRSMESLSTDFDDDHFRLAAADKGREGKLVGPKEIRKLERENSLVKTIKNRDKALTNREEIEKVLMGVDHLSRIDSLNLRRKLEEERLSRAMSMYDLSHHRKYYDPYALARDDESVSSSVLLDYPLHPRNLKQMHKQRLVADALKSGDDRYLDKLLLSDHMFLNEPYGDQYEKEIMYWFKNRNAKKEKPPKLNAAGQSSSATNLASQSMSQPNSSTLPRRMSRAVDEQIAGDGKHHQSFKLPPIPQQRSEDYETWIQKQQEESLKKQ